MVSIGLLVTDAFLPFYHIKGIITGFLKRFDFSTALLHGMLCFLLFAGAWNVNFESFRSNRTIIAGLLALKSINNYSLALLITLAAAMFNAALFLIIGLELFVVQLNWTIGLAAAFTIPVVLIGRLVSVVAPVYLLNRGPNYSPDFCLFSLGVG